ncbi:diol dehydratase small subunit [Lentilactobacillus sp. Marseille-Q4993]|uniref:diol dehydratase small subunit n=1 Tax=Lentilactobacillus sp. Marseille-Q4993 TaxID=3039492 RepID=UPI0024BC8C65|nr:diol dehydratase small subunit [Lentilactobacillus sp. Marseille-Q4993]
MSEVDELVSKILTQIKDDDSSNGSGSNLSTPTSSNGAELGRNDYPLYQKHPEKIKSPTGKPLDDITVKNIASGKVDSKDMRITPDTLRMQGEIAKNAGRPAIQKNFQRAAELTKIPDDRLLEMYNSLRPYRSSKQELLDISSELKNKYNAPVCAGWFEEAADFYEKNKKLKGDN